MKLSHLWYIKAVGLDADSSGKAVCLSTSSEINRMDAISRHRSTQAAVGSHRGMPDDRLRLHGDAGQRAMNRFGEGRP